MYDSNCVGVFSSPHDIILLAEVIYHSKSQWMILKDHTVGGLYVYCVHAFIT